MNSPLDSRGEASRLSDLSGLAEVRTVLGAYAALLPVVEPIGEFIHYNTLQAFIDRPFDEAIEQARELYGARCFMPLSFYRSKLRGGMIAGKLVDRMIAEHVDEWLARHDKAGNQDLRDILLAGMRRMMEFSDRIYEPREAASALRGLRGDDKTHYRELCRLTQEDCFRQSISQLFRHAPRMREATRRLDDDLRRPLRELWTPALGEHVDWLANPLVYRTLSGFLDQGVATWELPGTQDTFFAAARELLRAAAFPRPHGPLPSLESFSADPDQAIVELLQQLVGDQTLWSRYLREMMAASPGWSSLICQLMRRPDRLRARRKIGLNDFVAFRLLVEYAILRGLYRVDEKIGSLLCDGGVRRPGLRGSPVPGNPLTIDGQMQITLLDCLVILGGSRTSAAPNFADVFRFVLDLTDLTLERLWHRAFEQTFYDRVLEKVMSRARELSKRESVGEFAGGASQHSLLEVRRPSAQLLFCLDDRECSMRRHVEQLDPDARTFGLPGFFGMDIMFLGLGRGFAEKYCPVPVEPRHLVIEDAAGRRSRIRGKKLRMGDSLFSPLRLAQVWLMPELHARARRGFRKKGETRIRFRFDGEIRDGFQVGFTPAEMADRVENVLRMIGLTSGFAPVVLLVAHGSSAMNNPYFAAYECAACSGRAGLPNARVFASMGNDPDVRKILASRGIDVPADTRFIGSLHDTAMDSFEFCDLHHLDQAPSATSASFEKVRRILVEAAGVNAMERCQRFEKAPRKLTPESALREVRLRASALFEPRAELGHATNATCIVGRRDLTAGISLERRSFLNSYDPFTDPDGRHLAGILGAAIPVCAGVNLDYFFSRIDNRVFGSGSKLSHNVVGMVGVVNGVDDDLQTGLPSQMVELHDPIRLLFIIEQRASVVRAVIDRSPALKSWVDHCWIRVVTVDPFTGEFSGLHGGGVIPLDLAGGMP